MKKGYILVIIFIIFIILISIIGSIIVTGDVAIKNNSDILLVQDNKELYFSSYGYSIDNPNVIVNPYGNSPLTALVMFDTNNYSKVSICVKGKNSSGDINYTFDSDKHHLIPIYGLYSDYDNQIIIKSEGKEKVISIKTDKLPSDFEHVNDENAANFRFYNGNYPYAIDSNRDVRWYLNSNYYGNINVLDNSRIIIGSDRYTETGNTISLYEMNLLGKIYNEYLLADSYYGYNAIYNDDILILSDKILLIDRQTGDILSEYGDNDDYDYIGVNKKDIVVHNEDGYYTIKEDDIKKIEYSVSDDEFSFYSGVTNYKIIPSKRYGELKSTNQSSKNISLIKYKNKKIKNIKVEIDGDRIKVTNNNKSKIYIILDKFMDKRIYEVSDIKYINTVKLKGKYTIYYSVNGKVYKTNNYIEVK